jgi:Uma2 family endonuclease
MMATQAALLPDHVSFEEYLAAYDGVRAEWVDGTVLRMSPTSDRHADISDFLVTLLRVLVDSNGAGIVRSSQVAMRMGRIARVPDLLFVAREHASRLTATHLEGPADLAIEIVSPDSRTRDRNEKFREYEEAGVREYWIIDPLRESVDLFRLGSDGRYARADEHEARVLRSDVLPGFWIDTHWLWSTPMPSVTIVLKEWGLI